MASSEANDTLTAVAGIRVGHDEMPGRATGCSVVLAPPGTVGAVDVRGGAPGTREVALLDPVKTVSEVHAVVLAGGSAFGLATADGVMAFLAARDVGHDTGVARVPIVPAAILFDLGVGGSPTIVPDADCGRRAAEAASRGPVTLGSVGAGAGASVGKLRGLEHAMRGGLGCAAEHLDDGTAVAALIVVNALGDVIDPRTSEVVAGARSDDGRTLAGARVWLRSPSATFAASDRNTTLGVIATDARLTPAQATAVAQMAHDGLARTIDPVHTPWDGDAVFVLATGARNDAPNEPVTAHDVLRIGAAAAHATADAVLRGVRRATGLPGLPAARDLRATKR